MTTSDSVYFLLVDDLEENLLALEALLRRDGLVLLKAKSGTEALELLLLHDVALALVDVQMPEMDGFELAELIRGTERTRRVPIIFLTAGSPDPQRRFRGYEAGAVDFIRKPVEVDVLRSKADVFFELYRQRQEVARQRDELRSATEENSRLLAESRRQAQALQEADRRKDEFLATLAHELRNPLAPIRNAAAVMRAKGLADSELEAMRDIIERQAGNMTRLVDELLDVSRIATGKLVLQRQPTELKNLINGAIELARSIIESNRHQLAVDLPENAVQFDADEIRLTQVFSNLLTNAAKYTEPGGRIRISASVTDGSLSVRVQDTGVGIPREMLSEVFGLFTQVDRSLDRAQGGLGVGLALVRNLVELHGGTVSAESAGLGCGSTFIVNLPIQLETNKESDVTSVAEETTVSAPAPTVLRVLIVDDNTDGANTLAMLLNMKGHETRIANTGHAGLDAAAAFQPDVIFLDIGLPGMSGYEVARALRSEPRSKDATLVALTGWATEEDKRQAIEAGFNIHLTKPMNVAAIDQIIESIHAQSVLRST